MAISNNATIQIQIRIWILYDVRQYLLVHGLKKTSQRFSQHYR